MQRFFTSQPSASSAAQPAQSPTALRSIADVALLFRSRPGALGTSDEAKRIQDVVNALMNKPRRADVDQFFVFFVKQKVNNHKRPLPELMLELSTAVVQAASKLQLRLASTDQPALASSSRSERQDDQDAAHPGEDESAQDQPPTAKAKPSKRQGRRNADSDPGSAARPASSSQLPQPPASSSAAATSSQGDPHGADADTIAEDPLLAELQDRQQKRAVAEQEDAQDQPPAAKAKASRRPRKRAADGDPSGDARPASSSQSKQRRLSAEAFQASAALEPSFAEPAPTANAELHAFRQQMHVLFLELRRLKTEAWIVDADADALLELAEQCRHLQHIPCTRDMLHLPHVRRLYVPVCGTQKTRGAGYQDYTYLSITACGAWQINVAAFLKKLEVADDAAHAGSYPRLHRLLADVFSSPPADLPTSAQQLLVHLKQPDGVSITPFGTVPPPDKLFDFPGFHSIRMFAALELPHFSPASPDCLPDRSNKLLDMVARSRGDYQARASTTDQALVTADDIKDILETFYNDPFSNHAKRRWLLQVLKVPQQRRSDSDHVTEVLSTIATSFVQALTDRAVSNLQLSAHSLASCALYHGALLLRQPKGGRTGPTRIGPMLRLLANSRDMCGKSYMPQDLCGEDVELATNRLPAYWARMRDEAAAPNDADQPASAARPDDSMIAIATPPVMCGTCGEGFTHLRAFFEHCTKKHGDYAEYRKRLFWRTQKDGFKPLLPWVKRHILQSATFHLTYSIPGSFSLKWSHPDPFNAAMVRSEVACVVCARKDWLENRFRVYLWRQATGSKSYAELRHNDSGDSQLLTRGEHLCFGSREKIDEHLGTMQYHQLMPLIPQDHLYASSAIHPEDATMSWLLHSRRVPLLPNSRQVPTCSAERPASQWPCAGVGDPDAVAWICYGCATCLCVEDKLIKMPEDALANLLWLGRLHPLLQNATLGLRLLLGLGRPCFRKLLLGRGKIGDREAGLTGNHVLVSQAPDNMSDELPPASSQLSEHFVVIFGQSVEDLRKCQILTVRRDSYKTLVEERSQTNPVFAEVPINSAAVEALPREGVPSQIAECAVHVPEADRYQATRAGPGSLRDPVDAPDAQDDASDELDADEDEEQEASSSAEQPAAPRAHEHLNQFETPLGLDPTATPDVVQHLAAFKTQVSLVHEAMQRSRASGEPNPDSDARPVDADVSAATSRAAAEEECYRAVVDLRATAQQLDKIKFQEQAARMDRVDKALLVPSGKALSIFDPSTWTKCFSEYWFGDCLPNDPNRPRKITFERLFELLPDREELEYHLDSDGNQRYHAGTQSRFDTPEFAIVHGSTLRQLLLFRGTRLALRRKGFQRDVRAIANATSEQCMQALRSSAGQRADLSSANAEALARSEHVPAELATAVRQMLISTKDVPLTDGYRRSLRHEGHNLNVTYGTLAVFATYNFADYYSPILFQLLDGDEHLIGEIACKLTDDAPNMLMVYFHGLLMAR